ncbi:hypothetical protein PUNSTDRAFT_45287 [Punctularia strigosozonata HHB-11173 SS5]|uniref:uncharacterized protein n=1 Tax=Punctularia strigosozonata (strain HHB-11173) TaxID=741275 RepID=UPI0004416633|nr:uncharacterized protein PUNSTDRAFT_45287 [Punctularia strigosozonata HHB-11173 SS5]EIN07796.1 hypothetical protein PUNSTDRAFT_45287 [Punctularia strigosozonata HHB-11173 SS5]
MYQHSSFVVVGNVYLGLTFCIVTEAVSREAWRVDEKREVLRKEIVQRQFEVGITLPSENEVSVLNYGRALPVRWIEARDIDSVSRWFTWTTIATYKIWLKVGMSTVATIAPSGSGGKAGAGTGANIAK